MCSDDSGDSHQGGKAESRARRDGLKRLEAAGELVWTTKRQEGGMNAERKATDDTETRRRSQ